MMKKNVDDVEEGVYRFLTLCEMSRSIEGEVATCFPFVRSDRDVAEIALRARECVRLLQDVPHYTREVVLSRARGEGERFFRFSVCHAADASVKRWREEWRRACVDVACTIICDVIVNHSS